MGNRDVSTGVKKYIYYVCLRNELVKRNLIDISDNQQSYFRELKKGIFLWGKENRISFNYELGKISFDRVKQLLGYEERRTFRFLHNAREKLVKRIYELENELFIKYPFIEEKEIRCQIGE